MPISPLELHRIEVALSDFYSEGEISTWLNSPHPLLDGRKAIECPAADVWRVIDQLQSGAFV